MSTVITREYNPTTGVLIGNVSTLEFGNVQIGGASAVRVVALYVPDVSFISNVRLEIVSATVVPVNESPQDITADGSAGNGNFGIEYGSNFVARRTLTRFFAGTLAPVEVGTKSGNVGRYVYLSVKMNASSPARGSVKYRWLFDYS